MPHETVNNEAYPAVQLEDSAAAAGVANVPLMYLMCYKADYYQPEVYICTCTQHSYQGSWDLSDHVGTDDMQ